MKTTRNIILLGLLFITQALIGQQDKDKNVSFDFDLKTEFEYTYFWEEPQFEGQGSRFPAFSIQPEFKLDWNNGYESINFTGFFRLDRDASRTHWDIRELYYLKAKSNWELSVGLKKIYWGVTESSHLVDIINQTDQVESFDGEEKMGQPMIQFAWYSDRLGSFELFYLPHHRKRTFSGEDGRLRFGTVINGDDLVYESKAEEWRQDLAARWSHYFGIVDIGITHFYGNSRDPYFSLDPINGSFEALYPVINQTGLDLQVTHNAFLWKLETIYRSSDFDDFVALAAGFEYTFSNVNGKGLDISLLGEYLYDSRDELTLSSLDNDLFVGNRFALNDENDTSLLWGGIFDLQKGSRLFFIELARRIGSDFTLELETRILNNISQEEIILHNFRDDSFVKLSFSKYW